MLGATSLWRIPINPERLINLEKTLRNYRESKKILQLLLKHRVLYFNNIPLDYLDRFYNAKRVWEHETRRHGWRMRCLGQTAEKRVDAVGNSNRNSDVTIARDISVQPLQNHRHYENQRRTRQGN